MPSTKKSPALLPSWRPREDPQQQRELLAKLLHLRELHRLKADADRRQWHRFAGDPVGWITTRVGEETWSKQREIMAALLDHRRVAVRSCHGVGKSHIASRVVAWWLDSHPDAFVVTSAPTYAQVRGVLWRYIRQVHRKGGGLPGRVNQTEWLIDDDLVGVGRKPADQDEASMQGYHAAHLLVVLDEACGIPEALWAAADSLTSNTGCQILAIGNPDNPQAHFAKVCAPGSGWHTIGISAFDSPNLTGEPVPEVLAKRLISREWVEEKAIDWGVDNPIYISKVLGQFPPDDPNSVVRASDIAVCRIGSDMPRAPHELVPVELGVDVGGGGDETVIRERRGPVAGREWRHQSDRSEEIAPLVLMALRETGATVVKIDRIGVGAGLIGELRNMATDGLHHARIVPVNVAEKAHDEIRFANLRAQIWWEIGRGNSERHLWDLSTMDNADTTCAQLLAPRWSTDTKGRILIEKKDEIISRLGRSPDNADALLLAFYSPKGDLTGFFDQLNARSPGP